MRRVDYDAVAASFDQRYRRSAYSDVERALLEFVGSTAAVLEAGCGTGHWLQAVHGTARALAGIDRSFEMLRRARLAEPSTLLVHATAEELPLGDGAFDRVFCINALHHFPDMIRFMDECRRVLRAGGKFLTIGLDPHNGNDQWWIYDFFPSALTADLQRYPPTSRIRDVLRSAGFGNARSAVVQHLPATQPYDVAVG